MRKLLAVPVLIAVLALGAGSASAAIANFRASLTGTYTTSGSVTESGCWAPGPPPDGDQIPLPPQTGHVTATDSFSSVRPNVIQVGHIRGEPVGAGRLHPNGVMPLKVTSTRTSTLGSYGTVNGCTPAPPEEPPSDCGTKAGTYGADIVGARKGQALGFTFIKAHAYIYQPDDPFSECGLTAGENWMGHVNCPMAKVSLAKLFNPRVHKIVLSARGSKTLGDPDPGDQTSAGSTYTETYKLTLIRIKGSTHT
jgi:rubredoxin